MRANKLLLWGFSMALALTAIAFNVATSRTAPKRWDSSAITASYVDAQLRQVDSNTASLYLAYEIRNHTDSDYRLADGPEASLMMIRLRADGSLSSLEQGRLSTATFLPAGQRARVTLEIPCQFRWPDENDPAFLDRLRGLVNQKLAEARAFVLFDQIHRVEIEFPSGWQELKLSSASPR